MLSKKILPSAVANATLDNEIKGVWAGNGNMVIETGGLTIIVKTPSAIFKTAKIANPTAYLQSLMETDNGGRIQYPSLLDSEHQRLKVPTRRSGSFTLRAVPDDRHDMDIKVHTSHVACDPVLALDLLEALSVAAHFDGSIYAGGTLGRVVLAMGKMKNTLFAAVLPQVLPSAMHIPAQDIIVLHRLFKKGLSKVLLAPRSSLWNNGEIFAQCQHNDTVLPVKTHEMLRLFRKTLRNIHWRCDSAYLSELSQQIGVAKESSQQPVNVSIHDHTMHILMLGQECSVDTEIPLLHDDGTDFSGFIPASSLIHLQHLNPGIVDLGFGAVTPGHMGFFQENRLIILSAKLPDVIKEHKHEDI